MKSFLVKAVPWILIACALVYGSLGRWESVRRIREAKPNQTISLSHDEIIFLTLSKNINEKLENYNVRNWYQQQKAAGQNPPEYLNKPLFKHPPLFALFLGMVQSPGPSGIQNAFIIMFLLGIAVCIVVYDLGRCLLTPFWSLAAAALAWVDPILWAGSIKVWVDMPMTFFCLIAVWLGWRVREHPPQWLAMGFCFGLAFLTKYPAIIVWALTMGLLWLSDKRCRKNLWFWLAFFLPWLMFLPWLIWNFQIYGWSGFNFEEARHGLRIFLRWGWLMIPLVVLLYLIWRVGIRFNNNVSTDSSATRQGRLLVLALFILTLVGLFLFHSWFWGRSEPQMGFSNGCFVGKSILFYPGRLLNLNPFFWPALITLFLIRLPAAANYYRWIVLGWLLVFSLWGNYQSRYIMMAAPLLCVLSAWSLSRMAQYLVSSEGRWLERAWFSGWILFAVWRLAWIHQHLSIPNRFTYF